MSTIAKINSDFDSGRVTENEAVNIVLSHIDTNGLLSQLDGLTPDLLLAVNEYVQQYHEGQRSTAAKVPSTVQVEFAKSCLAAGAKQGESDGLGHKLVTADVQFTSNHDFAEFARKTLPQL